MIKLEKQNTKNDTYSNVQMISQMVGILGKFSKIYIYDVEIATFDMIVPGQENLKVSAIQMFDKLLDTLFSAAYKNLQVCIYFCYDKLFRVLNYSVLQL